MGKLTPETPTPKTKLLTWIENQVDPDNGKPLTIGRFAIRWGVSTLWLIAHGRVRATYDNGIRIERGTLGHVTVHDVCGPDALLPSAITAKSKRKRARATGKRSAARPRNTTMWPRVSRRTARQGGAR